MFRPTVSKPVGASEAWPYPRWIAHRGAGTLAPENTRAAFECGAQAGYRMFECDIRQSADGVWFLMHDGTLNRTTNGQGWAHAQPWASLERLDAGSWHSPDYAGQPLPLLEAVLQLAQNRDWRLDLELKPSSDPLQARQWGEALGHWLNQNAQSPNHLITSFSAEALAGLQATAPQWQRGRLFEAWSDSALQQTQALGCHALILAHGAWTAEHAQRVRQAGLWSLAYTVNETADADRLWAMGLDALITDRIDLFHPDR